MPPWKSSPFSRRSTPHLGFACWGIVQLQHFRKEKDTRTTEGAFRAAASAAGEPAASACCIMNSLVLSLESTVLH